MVKIKHLSSGLVSSESRERSGVWKQAWNFYTEKVPCRHVHSSCSLVVKDSSRHIYQITVLHRKIYSFVLLHRTKLFLLSIKQNWYIYERLHKVNAVIISILLLFSFKNIPPALTSDKCIYCPLKVNLYNLYIQNTVMSLGTGVSVLSWIWPGMISRRSKYWDSKATSKVRSLVGA